MAAPPAERPAPAAAPGSATVRWSLLVLGLAATAWMALALWPHLILIFGLEVKGSWFLDSYAILATLDARRAGLDPLQPNPFDVLHRAHVYSDWWYGLGWLGLGRKDNFVLGCLWVAGFLASALAVLRVRTAREAGAAAVLLASPPVLLAVYRANNDLVIFILLAGAGLAIGTGRTGWLTGAGGLVGLATGLKFYPAVAAGCVVVLRPVSRLGRTAAAFAIILGLVVWNVWSQAGRGNFDMVQDVHKLGAMILVRDLGLDVPGAQAGAAVLILGGGGWLAALGWTRGLALPERDLRERACFLIGALVLLACFLAGVSFAYRWIFLVLLLPWLGRTQAAPRGLVRLTLALLFFAVWSDGLLCAALNLGLVPRRFQEVEHTLLVWRLWTQPLIWLFVVLLAGWCIEAALAAARDGWTAWKSWRRPA